MGGSGLDDLPAWAAKLIGTVRVARLGLLDDGGHPRVLPITFAVADGRIWSAVDEKPKAEPGKDLARVRFLRRDPRAAITVDRYSDDWRRLAWVQLLGPARVVETRDGPNGLARLVAKYPQYGDSPPPGPLIALEPERCLFWRARGGD